MTTSQINDDDDAILQLAQDILERRIAEARARAWNGRVDEIRATEETL